MAIYARKKVTEYSVAPEGLWPAVCVDVFDLGVQQTPWGDQVKIEVTWQLEERDPETQKRFLVFKRYTPSLHEKANLRKDLERWRGRSFTREEEAEFDIEKLLGANCQLMIVHNIKDEGRVYANVGAITKAKQDAVKLRPEEYVRKIDRAKNYENHPNGNGQVPTQDDTPF